MKAKGESKCDRVIEDDDIALEASKKWRDYSVTFHFALHDFDVGVVIGTCVAIVGPNGSGKSILLNLLARELKSTTGESRQPPKLRSGSIFSAFCGFSDTDETPVEYLQLYLEQEGPSREQAVCNMLAKCGVPGNSHLTPIAKL